MCRSIEPVPLGWRRIRACVRPRLGSARGRRHPDRIVDAVRLDDDPVIPRLAADPPGRAQRHDCCVHGASMVSDRAMCQLRSTGARLIPRRPSYIYGHVGRTLDPRPPPGETRAPGLMRAWCRREGLGYAEVARRCADASGGVLGRSAVQAWASGRARPSWGWAIVLEGVSQGSVPVAAWARRVGS